jgi:hypothetical protein
VPEHFTCAPCLISEAMCTTSRLPVQVDKFRLADNLPEHRKPTYRDSTMAQLGISTTRD